MRGLYMLFNHSSIHGLPYLTSKHHGLFGRLVWLLYVLVSFSLAGLIIWKNVESWQSQPTVVSSVEYALIEDQPWLPQVVVCPNSLNSMAMFQGLVHATYKHLLTPERVTMIRVTLAKVKIMEDYYLSSRAGLGPSDLLRLNLSPYENCFKLQGELTEGCSLILVLTVLLDRHGFQKAQKKIVTYAANLATRPDTPNFLDYMSEINNVSLSDIKHTNSSLLTKYFGVLYLYNTFYDVTKIPINSEPQPLNSYITSMSKIEVSDSSQLGLYLSWILNGFSDVNYRKIEKTYHYNSIQELYKVVAGIWLDALKIYLNVKSDQRVLLLMNLFWHGGLQSSIFQQTKENRENGYMCILSYNNTHHDLDSVCHGPNQVGSECVRYCQLMVNMKQDTQTRIQEVLNMGLDGPSPTIGAFQSCQHPTKGFFTAKECWKKVVTDKGICYTSKGNGALTNIVQEGMKNDPIWFLFDGGQNVELLEEAPNSYSLSTLASSGNKRKVDVHVTPYYQEAVEDRLWEPEEENTDTNLLFTVSNDPQKHLYSYIEHFAQQATTHIEYVHNSTTAFKNMKPTQRNCYLPQKDKKLKHFDKYSEADCMLECAWEMAKEHCRCIPWYLGDVYPDQQMCEVFGNRCFDMIVTSRYKKSSLAKECQSNCLLDCDMIKYSTKREWKRGFMNTDLANNYLSLKAVAVPPEVLTLADSNVTRFLTKGNIYALELRLSNGKLAQNIVRTATMTTTDLISNVGGTLGLFCGLSLLSLVEIIYWGSKTLWGLLCRRKHGTNRKISDA